MDKGIQAVMEERQKQLDKGYHFLYDSFANGERQLERMARAMLCGDAKLAPPDWHQDAVAKLMTKSGTDKIRIMAALLVAQLTINT